MENELNSIFEAALKAYDANTAKYGHSAMGGYAEMNTQIGSISLYLAPPRDSRTVRKNHRNVVPMWKLNGKRIKYEDLAKLF